MKALALTLALLAAQASPVPLEHFTITIPEAGIYQMPAPLVKEVATNDVDENMLIVR